MLDKVTIVTTSCRVRMTLCGTVERPSARQEFVFISWNRVSKNM